MVDFVVAIDWQQPGQGEGGRAGVSMAGQTRLMFPACDYAEENATFDAMRDASIIGVAFVHQSTVANLQRLIL